MSNQRWKAKWKADDIAFHQHKIHPHLIRFWPQLALPVGATVLVPLCGKSLDLGWLHQQGHRVIGVELSHIAIAAYFAERAAAAPTPGPLPALLGGHAGVVVRRSV